VSIDFTLSYYCVSIIDYDSYICLSVEDSM